MSTVEPRLVEAMRERLARGPAGAPRVGSKIGRGVVTDVCVLDDVEPVAA